MWPVVLAGCLLAAGPQVELQSLSGTSSGELVKLNSSEIVVRAPEGDRVLPLSDLLRLNFQKVGAQGTDSAIQVKLRDGSLLQAASFLVTGGEAQVTIAAGTTLKIPTSQFEHVVLQNPPDELRAEWNRIVGQPRSTDVVVIVKENALDYLEGVLHDVDAERVAFEVDGSELKVKRARLMGLLYYQPQGKALPPSVCQLVDLAGSRIYVKELVSKEDGLEITTPGNVKLMFPYERLAHLQGNVEYLSDMTPLAVKMTPFFDLPRPPRFNANLAGGKLKLGDREFEKGIALHSKTSVTYHLGGKYRRLQAVAGIDQLVGSQGNAILILRGDQRQLLALQLSGAENRAIDVDLDVSGVQRLEVLVDFGPDLDVGDHVDLCNARMIP